MAPSNVFGGGGTPQVSSRYCLRACVIGGFAAAVVGTVGGSQSRGWLVGILSPTAHPQDEQAGVRPDASGCRAMYAPQASHRGCVACVVGAAVVPGASSASGTGVNVVLRCASSMSGSRWISPALS